MALAAQQTATPTDFILSIKDVTAKTSLCRASIYNRIAQGSFPKPIRLGARRVGWRESAVNEWLDNLEEME